MRHVEAAVVRFSDHALPYADTALGRAKDSPLGNGRFDRYRPPRGAQRCYNALQKHQERVCLCLAEKLAGARWRSSNDGFLG